MNFNFDSLMDTISNLRERGAEYANAAMDKTKDAARLAKLTVSLTGEKDALKKAYIELGKAYYEEHHNDAEGLYAQLVEEVDAVNARIEEMQAEIDALKGSFHVSEDASFENVVAQDENDGDEDISVEITVEEEPEAPAAPTNVIFIADPSFFISIAQTAGSANTARRPARKNIPRFFKKFLTFWRSSSIISLAV